MAALGFEVLFGALTVTGSFMAFGKLQELVPGRPVTYPGQNAVNIALFVATIGMLVYVVRHPLAAGVFYAMIGLGLPHRRLHGAAHRRRGHAGRDLAAELVRRPRLLRHRLRHRQQRPHHRGALDGASGFLLSVLMSKAMNRSFANVLFGAFGGAPVASAKTDGKGLAVRPITRRGRRPRSSPTPSS